METGPRRAVVIVSVVVLLICGSIVAFYLTSGFSSNEAQYTDERSDQAGTAPQAPSQNALQQDRAQMLQNLEAESEAGASASSSLDARGQMQQSQQPSPTPSSDERKKLLESFDE